VIVLLIALVCVTIDQGPSRAAIKSSTQSVVTPPANVPMLPGSFAPVNVGPGDQTGPHVYRDRVSYTNDDFAGTSAIHYFDFSNGTDTVVPGNTLDRLSDIFENHIAFTELTGQPGDLIVVYDTTTQTSTPVSCIKCTDPKVGGNLVAFEDRNHTNPVESDIGVYDISTGAITHLTNDDLFDQRPSVSPDGNAIVWEKCATDFLNCDVYSAVQTSPGVFTVQALTTNGSQDPYPDTNGEVAVYVSTRGGETDVYYQPIGGGTETQIAMPFEQRDVRVSGNLIVFESWTLTGWDIFVYDINTTNLYRVTNTISVDEALSDISVWNGTGRIVYAIPGGFGDFDVHAFTFQVPVPSSTPNEINDLVALIGNFNLPHGIAQSLVTKLQSALAALAAADTATACDSLTSFINECSAQSGKALTEEQASQLINAASGIRTELGCP